eukprot:431650-Pyramimonas_sp.AAC.1
MRKRRGLSPVSSFPTPRFAGGGVWGASPEGGSERVKTPKGLSTDYRPRIKVYRKVRKRGTWFASLRRLPTTVIFKIPRS